MRVFTVDHLIYVFTTVGCLGEHKKKLVIHWPPAGDLQTFQLSF